MTGFALMHNATEMTSVIVHCRCCGVPLTQSLSFLTEPSRLSKQDGKPYLPSGYFLISDGDYFPQGQLVVNLEDLVNTDRHSDPRRLNGCCGLDGCDGMNTICREGHEVGTERSDCWWAHAIHFDPLNVLLKSSPVPVTLSPAWLVWNGSIVLNLAKTIEEERAFDRLSILADALEEAGCTDADILNHCRQPGEHVRGCWVIDALLGKN